MGRKPACCPICPRPDGPFAARLGKPVPAPPTPPGGIGRIAGRIDDEEAMDVVVGAEYIIGCDMAKGLFEKVGGSMAVEELLDCRCGKAL